jgi:hypothetical protein
MVVAPTFGVVLSASCIVSSLGSFSFIRYLKSVLRKVAIYQRLIMCLVVSLGSCTLHKESCVVVDLSASYHVPRTIYMKYFVVVSTLVVDL